MLNRAFALLTVKEIDEEDRIIEGVASTSTPDRTGDIVMAAGAEFSLPIPFLWHHDSRQPIGHVIEAKVKGEQIHIKAQIVKIEDPGKLKERVDEAWQSIKSGLVRGLSIGFKPLEALRLEDTYNMKFVKWLWLELSAVTIAANGEASITAIKAIGNQELAATGRKTAEPVRLISPGVAGKKPKEAKPMPKEGDEMKNVSEQITALENTRAAKAARMEEVTKRSMDANETMNAEETEEFDTLEAEVKSIDDNLRRLRSLEKVMANGAKPVTEKIDKDGVTVQHSITVKEPVVPPGIRMARVVRCMGIAFREMSKGNVVSPETIAKSIYKNDPVISMVLKANIGAGTGASGNWAEGLIGSETSVFADFVEYLRPMTILGKFGANGIPNLRRVPFRVALVGQTGGGNGYWVGEGTAKPLTSFDFSRTTLEPLKVANICVLTDELVRDSSPSAEGIIRDSLVAALRERLDLDFINPDKAASAGVSPAGILNGVVGINSSGIDADAVRVDIANLFSAFIAANNPPTAGVLIMSARSALMLSLMRNPLGQKEFPDINMNGGSLEGLPVITSEYVTPSTDGDFIALINASDIYFSDEGGFNVDMSREASLEMSDAPAHNSTTPTPAQLVSMFQTNSVAFRAERTVNWKRRRNDGVAWIKGVAYTASGAT